MKLSQINAMLIGDLEVMFANENGLNPHSQSLRLSGFAFIRCGGQLNFICK
ncbi:MAG: hypothetical protein KJ963_06870 [Bacteroidetes bacterium]|nr:hypothetical protein [Bacteroidota bacterium]MBU1421876.1 hypothetical protein [Bacteroidota bacterium]MBU2636789.1 hypothetical protein [Bacteroidota bacterium]